VVDSAPLVRVAEQAKIFASHTVSLIGITNMSHLPLGRSQVIGKRPMHAFFAMLLVAGTFVAGPVIFAAELVDQTAATAGSLRVGPTRALRNPSDAARVARDGDTIEIDAGAYPGDVAVWKQHNLRIRGVGGTAQLPANGSSAEDKATWVIKGFNTRIERVEFSGAVATGRNGAGIRLEGTGLTLLECYFHDNENGVLTGVNTESDIVIERSEFAYNGHGDGYSHNLYIGTVRSLTLRFNYIHHAKVGHNVKSRALSNYIAYNRIMDERDGSSSYAIDLPNGGTSYLIGNVIQQGPATQNRSIVAYGAEGFRNTGNELYLINNTLIDDLPVGGRFVAVWAGAKALRLVNNIFSGNGTLLLPPMAQSFNNVFSVATDFMDPVGFDYRLKRGAQAIGAGVDPGTANTVVLRPDAEYAHKSSSRPRDLSAPLDAGAFQYR
jgi:hypothetical protein